MDGAFKAFIKQNGTCVVEDFARKHREDCQLRLAKIANGADPKYKNGYAKSTKQGTK